MEEKKLFVIRRLRRKTAEEIAELLKKESVHCDLVYGWFTADLTIESKKEGG